MVLDHREKKKHRSNGSRNLVKSSPNQAVDLKTAIQTPGVSKISNIEIQDQGGASTTSTASTEERTSVEGGTDINPKPDSDLSFTLLTAEVRKQSSSSQEQKLILAEFDLAIWHSVAANNPRGNLHYPKQPPPSHTAP